MFLKKHNPLAISSRVQYESLSETRKEVVADSCFAQICLESNSRDPLNS
jgi:hypothetical protein